MYKKYIKRVLDLLISILFIILFFWLYIIIAICIKIDSKGSILFIQNRVGINNKVVANTAPAAAFPTLVHFFSFCNFEVVLSLILMICNRVNIKLSTLNYTQKKRMSIFCRLFSPLETNTEKNILKSVFKYLANK